MRNLKRALALALSSVMLMGMMVVGTSAAGFDDVTAAHDAEAIEVMQAIGVMVGDDKGNFNPDQKVTRAEAAVVIAKLMDLSVEDFNGADLTFTDVPEWAVPFVAAVQAEGIVAGYSAEQFGSNDTVKAVDFALMVMKTMGYFQFDSDYGTDYAMATASQAGKIDLFDDVDAGVNTPLDREQVARITLNALQSAIVYEDGIGLNIETDGMIITSAHKYHAYTGTSGKWNAINTTKGERELGEDLFDGKLTKNTDAKDDMGRPATQWNWKGEKIGVYAETADQTVVVKSTYSAASSLKAYLENVDDEYEEGVLCVYLNGDDTAVNTALAIGDKVEYFLNDNGIIKNAAVIRYGIAQIEDVDTEVSKADAADGVTCYVDMGLKDDEGKAIVLKDTKIAGFDAETYVEDAYVLFALDTDVKDGIASHKIIASELAESLTGEVTAVNKEDKKVKIDGEWYTDKTESLGIGDKVVAYLDLAGQIVKVDDKINASEDYAYLRHIHADISKDGLETATFTAYVVLTDGTSASYVIEEDSADKMIKDGYIVLVDEVYELKADMLVAYSVNKAGELVIETAADEQDTVELSATLNKNNADIEGYNATAKTEFVFIKEDTDAKKVKTDVATGYKAVEIAAEQDVIVVYDEETKDALYVFVYGALNGNATSDMLLAVLADDVYSVQKDANGDKYYTYDVIIDGEETTLNTNCEILPVAKYAPFQYTLDKDGFVNIGTEDDDAQELVKATLTVANDNYIRVENDEINIMFNLGDEDRYTIVVEYNKLNSKVVDLTVKSGAALDKDDVVYVAYDAAKYEGDTNDLTAIFLPKELK